MAGRGSAARRKCGKTAIVWNHIVLDLPPQNFGNGGLDANIDFGMPVQAIDRRVQQKCQRLGDKVELPSIPPESNS
jgi:hypothetical protein